MGKIQLNKDINEDAETGAIAICALRYCMGRRTYMPGLVIDWVKRHWNAFSENDKDIMLQDLEYEVDRGRDLGDDCDVKNWMGFLEWMVASK